MVNAWGMGTSLPETDNDKEAFGTEVRFIGTDGKADIHYTEILVRTSWTGSSSATSM